MILASMHRLAKLSCLVRLSLKRVGRVWLQGQCLIIPIAYHDIHRLTSDTRRANWSLHQRTCCDSPQAYGSSLYELRVSSSGMGVNFGCWLTISMLTFQTCYYSEWDSQQRTLFFSPTIKLKLAESSPLNIVTEYPELNQIWVNFLDTNPNLRF